MKHFKKFALISGFAMGFGVANASPIVMSYYANWDTYSPANYPFPGNAQNSINNDLGYKLARINTLAYAFFEVDSNGYVYFTDPYSDLWATYDPDQPTRGTTDAFCSDPTAYGAPVDENSVANKGLNLMCAEVYDANNQSFYASLNGTAFGNFDDGFVHSGVPNLLVSIGGAGHDDSWQNAMNNPDNFVSSVSALVKYYGLQGVDIDYEPVGGMPSSNYQPFINLVTQLRASLGPNAIITYAIPANPQAIQAFGSANWAALMKQVSYVSIMGYDLHGEFDNPTLTDLQSSLYSVPLSDDPTQFSDDDAIHYSPSQYGAALEQMGVPLSQIILGYPAYGRAVSGVSANGIGQNFTASYQGDIDPANCTIQLNQGNTCPGMVQYSTIINPQSGFTAVDYKNAANQAVDDAYADNNGVFVSYDDVNSIQAKANYALQNQLGGMMFWEVRYDAPPVNADGSENSQSLLNTVINTFNIQPRPFTPTPVPPSYSLTITNTDTTSPLTGIVATISSFTSDYIAAQGGSKTYTPSTNSSLNAIEGKTGLVFNWYFGGTPSNVGTCNGGNPSFDFTNNTTITITNIVPNYTKGTATADCTVTQN